MKCWKLVIFLLIFIYNISYADNVTGQMLWRQSFNSKSLQAECHLKFLMEGHTPRGERGAQDLEVVINRQGGGHFVLLRGKQAVASWSLKERNFLFPLVASLTSLFLGDTATVFSLFRKAGISYKSHDDLVFQERIRLLKSQRNFLASGGNHQHVSAPFKQNKRHFLNLLRYGIYRPDPFVRMAKKGTGFSWEFFNADFSAFFSSESHRLQELIFKGAIPLKVKFTNYYFNKGRFIPRMVLVQIKNKWLRLTIKDYYHNDRHINQLRDHFSSYPRANAEDFFSFI